MYLSLANRIAVKKELRFELGLMKYTDIPSNPFKQVRAAQGGGTRHLTADRNTRVEELHEMARNLFFPDGYSRQGYLENFSTTMRDVSGIEILGTSTIHEQYQERKVKMLRIYLFIRPKNEVLDSCDAQQSDDNLPEMLSFTQQSLPDLQEPGGDGCSDNDGDLEMFHGGSLEGPRRSSYHTIARL